MARTPRTNRSVSADGPFLRGAPPAGKRIRKPMLYLCVVTAVVLLGMALTGENGLGTLFGLRSERLQAEGDVEQLREHHDELQAGLAALDEESGDPEALERVARERYRMLKPGETAIEVVGEDELPTADSQED